MLDEKHNFDTETLLDEVLTSEPGFALPADFAQKLAQNVSSRFAWKQYIKEFFIYVAAILGIAVVSAGIALIWYETDWKGWLNFLSSNISLVIGINILVIFVLFADRVLLRYFLFKSSPE